MSDAKHTVRFPGESEGYRNARNELLEAETALRRNIEAVAAKRRMLPLGGALPEDYVLDELGEDSSVREIRFSDLFAAGNGTLIVYSYMYGPAMAQPCPNCTSILDALDGEAPHVSQHANLAVIAKSLSLASCNLHTREAGETFGCSHRRIAATTATITQKRRTEVRIQH
jgi:predicted dithiol-disulfide oxidoreductase (DUF899 family)